MRNGSETVIRTIAPEFQRLRGPTFYDTCLNLVHLFLYMCTIYKICLVITPEN